MKTARLTALVSAAVALAATLTAQTTNYASSSVTIKVGTLLIDSQVSGGYHYNAPVIHEIIGKRQLGSTELKKYGLRAS